MDSQNFMFMIKTTYITNYFINIISKKIKLRSFKH